MNGSLCYQFDAGRDLHGAEEKQAASSSLCSLFGADCTMQ